jgi:hypothetical protein
VSISSKALVISGIVIGILLIVVAVTLFVGDDSTRESSPNSETALIETQMPAHNTQTPTLPAIIKKDQDEETNSLQLGGESYGTYPQWSLVELTFEGPHSSGTSAEDNPFKQEIEVTFISPDGEEFLVPGFYQGDGQGGLDGNIWQVRFTPNMAGEWSFSSSSSNALLEGYAGIIEVSPQKECQDYHAGDLPNYDCMGRLNYAGRNYLQFSDGTYWLKGGVDEPEDFLAPEVNAGFPNKEEAIDYLAEHGVNSIYLVLHNVDGDGLNVWPWLGSTQKEAKEQDEYFDIERLRQWEQIFDYIQSRGILLHLVLEDDSAWTGFNRQMYYREMVARFAHHNGLIWNISEEYNENYAPDEISQFAEMLHELDPYDHPITVHHAGRTNRWEPFVNDPHIDLTSFQTEPRPQNELAVHWFDLIRAAEKTIPISFDETGQLEANERDLARRIVWSVYLGGANYEIFTRLRSGYTEFEYFFTDLLRARKFIEQLPFESLAPCNELLQPETGYCLGHEEQGYVLYFPRGGSLSIDLSGMAGTEEALWFDPRTGETFPADRMEEGEVQSFSAPSREDWVLRIGFDQLIN